MKRLLIVLSLYAFFGQIVYAQLPAYPYPNFVPGATISSAEVNSNFATVTDNALKRNGGGILEGHLTLDNDITLDGADISDFLVSTGQVRSNVAGTAGVPALGLATDGWFYNTGEVLFALSGVEQGKIGANGLTIRGTNIFDATGKLPAITATYFANLAAQGLQLSEASFTDGTALARLAANETITGTYANTKGTITAPSPLRFRATWNNGAVSFIGVDVSITNTLSAATSKLINAGVAGSSKFSVTVAGKAVTSVVQITGGARANYFLVGDGAGIGTWQPSASAIPVPVGMLAFFEAACPTGWTSKSDAGNTYENKFVRGGSSFATGGGADTHTHSADPANKTSTTESNGHTHSLDVASFAYPEFGATDWITHTISGTTGTAGGLDAHTFITGTESGSDSFDSSFGAANFAGSSHTHSGVTNSTNMDHSHGAGSLTISGVSNHNIAHGIDFPATTTSGVSTTHTHDVDIAPFTSGSGSSVPAYVGVIMCRKD